MNRINMPGGALRSILTAVCALAAVTLAAIAVRSLPSKAPPAAFAHAAQGNVMLILRGIAGPGEPRGQLDDPSALEYARELGYEGEVLDVAGNTGAGSAQVRKAVERIRSDDKVTALYGFSGGGYNARHVWDQLSPDERQRIEKVVVVGSPGVDADDFPGSEDVVIKQDPPAGHMAGPKALLESQRRE